MAIETGKVVDEVVAACLVWADAYYRHPGGRSTGHVRNVRSVTDLLSSCFGSRRIDELRSGDFRSMQDQLVAGGLARTTVNSRLRLLRRVLRWAVSRDLASPDVLARCTAVEPLKAGRTSAREAPPVVSVSWSHVERCLPCLLPVLRAAVLVHWWSGMRVGELLAMRFEHVDRSGSVWRYCPPSHKTAHHGHRRIILLGPACQSHLASADAAGVVFRSTAGRPYTPNLYRQAIIRACDRAGVPRWTPLRLRHSAGTRFRAELGIEAARVLLGHRSIATTEIYAERDDAAALAAAMRVA